MATSEDPKGRGLRKERFFVRVPTTDGEDGNATEFFDVTEHLGKLPPFTKPKTTCAMRATDEVVAFSLLHLTKKTVASFLEKPMHLPKGPLARLERKAVQAGAAGDIDGDHMIAEIGEHRHRLTISRDDAGVATIDHVDEETPATFQLPRQALQLTVYLRSPQVDRVMAVSFIGYTGKPEDTESVVRAVSHVLFNLSQLVEFRLLAGIETVDVPPPPSRWAAADTNPVSGEEVAFPVPVRLYSAEAQPQLVGEGTVGVTVDLDRANPTSGRLLYHVSPDEHLAELFASYRTMFDHSITHQLRAGLGDEDLANIAYDVVLGAISTGDIERLREIGEQLAGGIDLTPTQYRLRQAGA